MRCCYESGVFGELGITHRDVARCWSRAHNKTHFGEGTSWFSSVVAHSKDAVATVWRTVDEMYEVRGVLSEVIVPEMVASCGSIDECLDEDGTVDEDKVAVKFGPLLKALMEDKRARRLGGTPGAYAEIWAHKNDLWEVYGDGLKKLQDARPPASPVDATASMEHVLGPRTRFGRDRRRGGWFKGVLTSMFRLVTNVLLMTLVVFALVLAYCYTVGMHDGLGLDAKGDAKKTVCQTFWEMWACHTGYVVSTETRLDAAQQKLADEDVRRVVAQQTVHRHVTANRESDGTAETVGHTRMAFDRCTQGLDTFARFAGTFTQLKRPDRERGTRRAPTTGEEERVEITFDAAVQRIVPHVSKVYGQQAAIGAGAALAGGAVLAGAGVSLAAAPVVALLGMAVGTGIMVSAGWNWFKGGSGSVATSTVGAITLTDDSVGRFRQALQDAGIEVSARPGWNSVLRTGFDAVKALKYAEDENPALKSVGNNKLGALLKDPEMRGHICRLLGKDPAAGVTREEVDAALGKDTPTRQMVLCVDKLAWEQASWWSMPLSSVSRGLFEPIGIMLGLNAPVTVGGAGPDVTLVRGVMVGLLVFALLIGYFVHPLAAGAVVVCGCVAVALYLALARADVNRSAGSGWAWGYARQLLGITDIGDMISKYKILIGVFAAMMLWSAVKSHIPIDDAGKAYMGHVQGMVEGAAGVATQFNSRMVDMRLQSDRAAAGLVGKGVGVGLVAIGAPVAGAVVGGALEFGCRRFV